METITKLIAEHWVGIALVSGYIFIGAVSTMPKPGDPRPLSEKLYESFYDLLHMLANKAVERRPNLALPAPPTQPQP